MACYLKEIGAQERAFGKFERVLELEPVDVKTGLAIPSEAQLSPVNAIASGDFNGDGRPEVILAQNHYTNQAETGLWRGNPGCHLEWEADGFVTIPHSASGVVLPNDTKSIISLDANGDGFLDLLADQNNDTLRYFRNSQKSAKD